MCDSCSCLICRCLPCCKKQSQVTPGDEKAYSVDFTEQKHEETIERFKEQKRDIPVDFLVSRLAGLRGQIKVYPQETCAAAGERMAKVITKIQDYLFLLSSVKYPQLVAVNKIYTQENLSQNIRFNMADDDDRLVMYWHNQDGPDIGKLKEAIKKIAQAHQAMQRNFDKDNPWMVALKNYQDNIQPRLIPARVDVVQPSQLPVVVVVQPLPVGLPAPPISPQAAR